MPYSALWHTEYTEYDAAHIVVNEAKKLANMPDILDEEEINLKVM